MANLQGRNNTAVSDTSLPNTHDTAEQCQQYDRQVKAERVWQSQFKQLASWYRRHGHYCIPTNRRDLTSLRLWMATQRRLKQQQKLSTERILQLQNISFIWNAKEAEKAYQLELLQQEREREQAEMETHDKKDENHKNNNFWKQYEALIAFYSRYGHFDIPECDDYYSSLREWTAILCEQYHEGNMSLERFQLLNTIGFFGISGDQYDDSGDTAKEAQNNKEDAADKAAKSSTIVCSQDWMTMYQQLQEFHRTFGHCYVDSDDHKSLYSWVAGLRVRPDALDERQKQLLNDIGFEWNSSGKAREHQPQALQGVKLQEQPFCLPPPPPPPDHKAIPEPNLRRQITTRDNAIDSQPETNSDKKHTVALTPRSLRQARILALDKQKDLNTEEGVRKEYATQPEEIMVTDTDTQHNAGSTHERSAEATSLSGSYNGMILGIAPAPTRNKWFSMWEAVVQDEHENYGKQPPYEISTQKSHADLSVITIEVDRPLSPWNSLSSQTKQPQRKENNPQVLSRPSSEIIVSLPGNIKEDGPLPADDPQQYLSERNAVCGKWMAQYIQLLKFHKLHGHCVLPLTEEYASLDAWLEQQRAAYYASEDSLPAHRRKLLENMNFSGVYTSSASKESSTERSPNKNNLGGSSPLQRFQPHPLGYDEDKRMLLKERTSPTEKWKNHNRKLVDHYKSLLKFYREQDRCSLEPDKSNTTSDPTDVSFSVGQAAVGDQKPFREVTFTRRIQNHSLHSFQEEDNKDNNLDQKSRSRPIGTEWAGLPIQNMEEFKTYLGQVEQELKNLKGVASKISALLEKVEATAEVRSI